MKKLKFIFIIALTLITIFVSACTKDTPTVTLDPNGGTLESSEVILSKKNEIALPNITKPGKTFLGWYSDDKLIENGEVVDSDLNLVAKWDKYDLTFLNDDNSVYIKLSIDHDTKISFPETNPTKEPDNDYCYNFDKWDIDENLIVTKDLTISPTWTSEAISWAKPQAGINPMNSKMFKLAYIYKESLFDKLTNEFNKDLALFAFGQAYSNANKTLITNFYLSLNFDDVYASSSYDVTPTQNSVAYAFAHKQIKDADVICVSIRGQNYLAEWSGNFNVGKDNNHTGFSIAASTVYDDLIKYLDKYKESANLKVLITGYSRAGAIANTLANQILITKLAYMTSDNLYVYTFEAPNCIASSTAIEYPNVFNIINSADLVTSIPPNKFGLKRCGRDIEIYSPDIVEILKEYGYLNRLPNFTSQPGKYVNDVAYVKYIINNLTNYNSSSYPSLNTRVDYYSNYQEGITYLINLVFTNNSNSFSKLANELSNKSNTELLALMTGNNLYNYLSNFLTNEGISYNSNSLNTSCNAITNMILGPAYSLSSDLLGSSNIQRALTMHEFYITYALLVNLE